MEGEEELWFPGADNSDVQAEPDNPPPEDQGQVSQESAGALEVPKPGDEVADQVPETEADPAGPGDLKVALKQARERERQTRDSLQTLQAQHQQQAGQLAVYQQYLAQLQQQREQGQQLEPLDPEAFEAIQQEIRVLREQQAVELRNMRAATSAQFARTTHPDYDDKMALLGKLVEQGVVNLDTFLAADNPAEAAYQFAAGFYQPASNEAQIRADERRKVLQEQAAANARGGGKAPPTLAGIPSGKDDAGTIEEPEPSWGSARW